MDQKEFIDRINEFRPKKKLSLSKILSDARKDTSHIFQENKKATKSASLPISRNRLIAISIALFLLFTMTAYYVQSMPPAMNTFTNSKMNFEYPQGWYSYSSDYYPELVTLTTKDAKIEILLLSEDSFISHQEQLVNARFTNRGTDAIDNIEVQMFTNSYLSTGSQVIYYYFKKNGKFYEVRGENIYESQDLIERIVVSIK